MQSEGQKLSSKLRVGDRVGLSELSKSLVSLPGLSLEALFGGNRTSRRLHRSSVELCPKST